MINDEDSVQLKESELVLYPEIHIIRLSGPECSCFTSL